METIREDFLQTICEEQPYKLVISNPAKKEQEIRKIVIQLQQGNRGLQYQIEKFTDKQAFHINIEERDLQEAVSVYFGTDFLQLTAWTKQWEYQGKISKKGKLLYNRRRNPEEVKIRQGNNREKQYCIPEGTFIPPLVDMGIFTKEGKVVQSKYDKYRQINRFLEMVEDALKELPEGPLNIIDFGCGKSYLTFLLYYYMVEVKKRAVTITGLDLKKTVIEQCRQTAERYHYDNLKFELGDIHGYQTTEPVDMVITLHACDTATDYALFNAIRWNSRVILSVPCCQHEFNGQMSGQQLSILSKYGIVKERTAALMTDAVRGNLLEYSGYKTQLLEFVDMEHSPKNILIRAVKENISEKKKQQALQEVKELMETFHFMPTLYRLIFEGEEHE
ncbi:MAG: SAM-dependent methyltransferase [Lachnospiraceae bacterium]|nr:SAM-dependent methyltransferase [Lachnospiraceae bacterium]